MDNLFQSFDARVSTDSFDTLSGCVISWLEEYCSPQVGGAPAKAGVVGGAQAKAAVVGGVQGGVGGCCEVRWVHFW